MSHTWPCAGSSPYLGHEVGDHAELRSHKFLLVGLLDQPILLLLGSLFCLLLLDAHHLHVELQTLLGHGVTSQLCQHSHAQGHTLLFSYTTFSQAHPQNLSLHKYKTYIPKYQTHFFKELVPSICITPVKKAHKARTCWYCQPFHLI